jgi:hypothetical protein
LTSYHHRHSVTITASWKQLYFEALRESDQDKLAERVDAAEEAMFLRSQELADSADDNEERSEIHVACAALLAIRINKLGCLRRYPAS